MPSTLNAFTPGAIPIFLGDASIGSLTIPAQIISFDSYYIEPIVVGFHVIGDTSYSPDVVGLNAQITITDTSPQVIGFYSFGSTFTEGTDTVNLVGQEVDQTSPTAPQVHGFYGLGLSTEPTGIQVDNFGGQVEIISNSPQVQGFYCFAVQDVT